MSGAGYRGIRGADGQVHVRLTRLCIHWLWFCHKFKHRNQNNILNSKKACTHCAELDRFKGIFCDILIFSLDVNRVKSFFFCFVLLTALKQ